MEMKEKSLKMFPSNDLSHNCMLYSCSYYCILNRNFRISTVPGDRSRVRNVMNLLDLHARRPNSMTSPIFMPFVKKLFVNSQKNKTRNEERKKCLSNYHQTTSFNFRKENRDKREL